MSPPLEQLHTSLISLGLTEMDARLEGGLEAAAKRQSTYADFLAELLQAELDARSLRAFSFLDPRPTPQLWVRQRSTVMMSGYSPLLWVQPSITHFCPLPLSRTTALVCGRPRPPRDSGTSMV